MEETEKLKESKEPKKSKWNFKNLIYLRNVNNSEN